MNNKALVKSLIFFVVSLVALTTSVFAWLAISYENKLGTIIAKTADFSANISFEVIKNEGEVQIIDDIEDMHEAFGYTLPGDKLHFTIKLINDGTKDFLVDIEIKNVLSVISQNAVIHDENFEANMLDVYYLENGLVKTTKYLDVNEVHMKDHDDWGTLPPKKLFEGTQYFMELQLYRLSNLIDENNTINILEDYQLKVGERISVEFTIAYDDLTSYPDYEFGELHFNSIYVYLT